MGFLCPAPDLLERFRLGQVSIEERETLAAHVEHCPDCAERLSNLPAREPLPLAMQTSRHIAPSPTMAVDPFTPHGSADKPDETGGSTSLSSDTLLVPPSEEPVGGLVSSLLAAPAEPDELGRLGPYRVLRILGRGGMGIVFLAEDPCLKRKVALKALGPALRDNPSARQRFLREAQTAAALEHDHIIAIYQVGEDRGVPFLAMPLLKGESLEDRLRREGRLPIADVLRIGREIAEGLAAAHKQGVIHRDIKPSNVWLEARQGDKETGQGDKETRRQGDTEKHGLPVSLSPCRLVSSSGFRVKILDFGLARDLEDDAHLSHSGSIHGTPSYMAPEQAKGQPADFRSDLFSLGCVLYRMATGNSPFKGPDVMSTLLAVALRDPPPPNEVVADLPQSLSDFILQLLAKEPAWRPVSAAAVALTLAAMERGEAFVPSPADTQIRAAALTQRAVPLGKAAVPRRRLVWTAAFFAGAAALVAAVLLNRPRDDQGASKESKQASPLVAAESPAAAWARRIGAQTQDRENKMVSELYAAYQSVSDPEAAFGKPLTGIQQGWADAKYIAFENGEVIFNPNTNRAYAIYGDIYKLYHSFPSPGGIFGHPLSGIQPGWRGAAYVAFEKGEIIWNPKTRQVHAMDGEIYRAYHELDNRCFHLGHPISGIQPGTAGAVFIAFETGQIIFNPNTKRAHAIFGKIFDAYYTTPNHGVRFGHPLTDISIADNGKDRYIRFENGTIYWDAETDRVEVKE